MISAEQTSPDRRPLASRGWPIMHRLARGVARAGISPNAVSLAGMAGGMLAGGLLAATAHVDAGSPSERALWIAAAACIQFRLVCNLIDGMVAVEGGRRTPTGEIFNEVPDRVSDACTLIGAGYAALSWPVLGYIGACLAIFVAYVRAVGKGCGMASDYAGPMAKQQRMFVVTAACIVAAALPVAWRVRIDGIPGGGLMGLALWIVVIGSVLTGVRRLARLASFLRSRAAAGVGGVGGAAGGGG